MVRTLNDLKLLAQAANGTATTALTVEDASAGLSPAPWTMDFDKERRRARIRDADGRLVAERTFPKSTGEDRIRRIVHTMGKAVETVNAGGLG
jgi:hypothetical protein